jgi:outer membrane protein TolC
MKLKTRILPAALLISMIGAHAQTTSIDHVLKSIEANNKALRANAQLVASQKLETRTDNNLPDPALSYAYMRRAGEAANSEMTLSQRFDFPTLYAGRRKLNKLKASALDSQAEAFRRDILLQAKEACLDIIMLRQQQAILDERLKNARELSAIYAERLERGDANIIETNKINLELLNVKAEANLNGSALRNKQQELDALNGNIPVTFNATAYPEAAFPPDYEQLRSEALSSDHALMALLKQSEAADRQVGLSKAQWLPKLELGYRRDMEAGKPFNGVVVGFSIPLFENRNKVKVAKAQSLDLNYRKENAILQTESELAQLYREAHALRVSMDEYEKIFAAQSDLPILKEALTGGEISMIEYFVEVAVVYQSKLNYLQLQNQYRKAIAKLYKNRL